MDLFVDKKYEQLDEISQLCEPYEFQVNTELAQFPDELQLDADFFSKLVSFNNGRATIYESYRKLIERNAKLMGLQSLGEWSRLNRHFAEEFFEFEIEHGSTYDPANNRFTGSAKIIKKKIAYEDKEIDEYLANYLETELLSKLRRPVDVNKARLNEVCDLFNAKEAMADRKTRGKVSKLIDKYKELMSDRTMNIRDVDLFKRFVQWNVKYVKDGNLPAMSNITKVKIMMRGELPIYSIKEDEV